MMLASTPVRVDVLPVVELEIELTRWEALTWQLAWAFAPRILEQHPEMSMADMAAYCRAAAEDASQTPHTWLTWHKMADIADARFHVEEGEIEDGMEDFEDWPCS